MQEITKNIQEEARKLLKDKKVDVIIGYQQAWDEEVVTPCFITEESQVGQLLFNQYCFHNLAKYLVGREGYLTYPLGAEGRSSRVAIVAKPETLRTIVGLIQENQFKREDVIVLGIVDGSPLGIEPDIEAGRIEEDSEKRKRLLGEIKEIEEMSSSDRWDYWERELSKCIRCYACRQVCPFCYCERCIVEENQPQWIGRSPSLGNNMAWHIIRAFHLVGRCTDCGECERVCPVGIPLRKLNAKMAAEVKEAFGYTAGTDMEALPPLSDFRVDDKEEFIK